MLEAKHRVESKGYSDLLDQHSHTHSRESAERIFVWICLDVCEQMQIFYSQKESIPRSLTLISKLRDDTDSLLAKQEISADEVGRFVPYMQRSHSSIR